MEGREVQRSRSEGERTTLSVAGLAPAPYILEVERMDGTMQRTRFVKR